MAQVELFVKHGTRIDKGVTKPTVRFYLKCGNTMVPVDIPYFENEKCGGRDPQYMGRKEVLKSYAEPLPDLPKSADKK